MILGTGIDVVNISRIENLLEKFGEKFEKKVFTDNEISILGKFKNKSDLHLKAKYYAKRFAAKEAFSKAVGLGIGRGIDFCDIEIVNDKNGKPEILLSKKAATFLQDYFKQKKFQINLSLCDEPPIAQAIVIISLP